jgi:hypothetical protein
VFFFSRRHVLPAVVAARAMFRLPYFTASMRVARHGDAVHYASRRRRRLAATYAPTGAAFMPAKGTLEFFLTERYCLYHLDLLGAVAARDSSRPLASAAGARQDYDEHDGCAVGPRARRAAAALRTPGRGGVVAELCESDARPGRPLHDRPTLAQGGEARRVVERLTHPTRFPSNGTVESFLRGIEVKQGVAPPLSSNVTVVTCPLSPPSSLVQTSGVGHRYLPKNSMASGQQGG